MAKLNVWFARGFSARVKSVDRPPEVYKDGQVSKTYFKNDSLRFQAYLKGYCSAELLFQDDNDPDHETLEIHEGLNWMDVRKRPDKYPAFLIAALDCYPEMLTVPGKVVAPIF